jgi:hypothetical protein
MTAPGQISYTSAIPAGTNVVAAWGPSAVLPGEETLREIVAKFGEPFTLAYMPSTIQHIGVRVAEETAAVDLGGALFVATGSAPVLMAAPSSADFAVDIEIDGEAMKEAIDGARKAIVDTTEDIGWTVGHLPIIVGAALVGVVLLAAGAFYYSHKKG